MILRIGVLFGIIAASVSIQQSPLRVGPKIIVDPSYFPASDSGPEHPIGYREGDTVINHGSVTQSSDGTVYVSTPELANGIKTYHYAGKHTNLMICDQTGETIAASSSN